MAFDGRFGLRNLHVLTLSDLIKLPWKRIRKTNCLLPVSITRSSTNNDRTVFVTDELGCGSSGVDEMLSNYTNTRFGKPLVSYTTDSFSSLFFKDHWRYTTIVSMATFQVVIKIDVVKYLRSRFVPRFIYLALDALRFQQREKTLCNGIVMAIPPAAHAEFKVVIFGELLQCKNNLK
jgi:hypothetical protein